MTEPEVLRKHPLARYGPYIGIAGSAVFLLLWLASATIAGSDWEVGRNTLSELGGMDTLAAPLFNFACVFAGICMFLFGFGVWMRVPEVRRATSFVRIAGLGLVLVGIFNINTGLAHDLSTILFFMMITFGVGLTSYFLIKNWMMLPTAIVGLAGICVSFLSFGLTTFEMVEAIAVVCINVWGFTMAVEMILGRDSAPADAEENPFKLF